MFEINKIVGIDTGMNGALAVLGIDGSVLDLRDMPMVVTSGARTYDMKGLKEMLRAIGVEGTYVVIEQTFPRSKYIGGSPQANWWLGAGCFLMMAVVDTMDFRYEMVDARVWTRYWYKGMTKMDTKTKSYLTAQRLFPEQELVIPSKRKNAKPSLKDGRCDSLLIAEYARRRLRGEES